MRRSLSGLSALAATLALGACGSSNSANRASDTVSTAATTPAVSTPATSPAPSTTTTPTITGASTTPTTPAQTTTSPSGGAPIGASAGSGSACRASDLELSYLGQQGAAGHGEIGFALRNRGTAPCHTYGFPGVVFVDGSGGTLQTATTRSTSDFAGSAPEVSLTLAPGESASFRLTVSHISSGPCTTAAGVRVIPPDDTASLTVTIPSGAYECGSATVSPLRPGNSAFA